MFSIVGEVGNTQVGKQAQFRSAMAKSNSCRFGNLLHAAARNLPSDFQQGLSYSRQQNPRPHGAAMKIVFGVKDVLRFKQEPEADGLQFGPIQLLCDFAA